MNFSGFVVHGDGEGTGLGFPTANLDVLLDLDPGVYAVWVVVAGERLPGVICSGALGGGGAYKCEVHLLDFVGDLYGQKLEVEVVGGRLSEIRHISDREALRKKIEQDIRMTRTALDL